MTTQLRRPLAVLVVLATTLSALLVGGSSVRAAAAEPVRTFALTEGHIDLFEVTYDADSEGLRLSVKDDTGLYGPTAYRDPSEVSVVLDEQLSQMDVAGLPASYDFLKGGDNVIYNLPMSQNPDLPWPGWSTERLVTSLQSSGIELPASGQPVQLAVDVEGPGDVFTWMTNAFGQPNNRYVDTVDPAADVIPVSRSAHVHTSWAFTEPGDYLLTVTPSATTTGGATLTGQAATYHVHIGDAAAIAAPENTSAPTLSGEARVGGTVSASAGEWTAEPEEYRYQWLRGSRPIEGATSETYDPVAADYARALRVRVSAVVAGRQAGVATSEPVYVADENGDLFAIAGIEDAYDAGDTLDATVVGHTLAEGEMYLWVIRPAGADDGYTTYGDDEDASFQGRLTQRLDMGHDGYELQVTVVDEDTWRSTGVESPWVPLSVAPGDDVDPISTEFPAGSHYVGDDVVFPLSRGLADGETARLVYRGETSPWFEVQNTQQVGETVVARPPYAMSSVEFAVQILRDGVAAAQSAPVVGEIFEREALVEGLRGVYRVGQTLSVDAEVAPPMEGLTYQWYSLDENWERVVYQEGTGPDALSLDLEATMDLDGIYLRFDAIAAAGTDDEMSVAYWGSLLKVSDADPDEQLLFFENLSDHYHQGYTVNLDLVADPGLAEGDTIAWEWKWPDAEWAPVPGASGLSHQLVAEQALDGVQVRATLDYADSEETVVTEPVTIHHDDHGGTARQQPTIGGETSYAAGETVTLARKLPANGSTVLTEHRWERQAAGTSDWAVVEGATGAELSFAATAADDGAAYRVSIVKPGGAVAYGPSPSVSLAVTPAAAVVAGAAPQISGQPVVGSALVATPGGWTPEPDDVSYQWFAGEQALPGATGEQLLLTEAQVGRQITVQVTATKAGHTDGTSTSDAVGPVRVQPAPAPQPAATAVSAEAVKQVYGRAARLDIAVSPRATGTVSVQVGDETVSGALSAGLATVTLPRGALEPGDRSVRISYAGVAGRFLPSVGSAGVRVVKAKPTIELRPLGRSVERGGVARIQVVVDAPGVTPSGVVVVKVAGRREVLDLDRRGRAVAKIAVPRSTRPGSQTVVAVYRGDAYVAQDPRTTVRLRVTR